MATKQRAAQRPQMTLRLGMDEQLDRLSQASGLTRIEIIARALNAFEPRILKAARALNPTREQLASVQTADA